jgi:phosphate transport system protein
MTQIDEDLAALRQRLLTMASHAAANVRLALRALADRDDTHATRAEEADDLLDELEKEIDDLAIRLLLRSPLARDLRLIVVATRIGHELERVGDEATAIARRARELNREPPLSPRADLSPSAVLVLEMLGAAIEAFVSGNAEKARLLILRDREVDELNKAFHREFTRSIQDDPGNLHRCLNLMAISKRLERIGDHAKAIAEEVVYLSEALDIRHTRRTPGTTGAPGAP